MKRKQKVLKKVTSLVLALTMIFGMMPAMALTSYASSAEEVWNDNQTIESTKTINGGVYVDLEVSVTISKGATLTINNGIYMREGAELTVCGEGTLIVNGHNGSNGSDDWGDDSGGGNGSDGESAINGNIIVEGGKVTVTGGRGGSGGYGGFFGGDGGDGGYGIKGNLTVNGGSVTVTGGSGGSGGTTSPVGDAGSNGSNTRAVSGDISGGEGVVVIGEESEDGSIWNYISGGSSDRQYVRAKVLEPVKVKLDAGTGHGALFTEEVLADMVSQIDGFASATREGDIITIGVTNTSMTEYELLSKLDEYIVTKLLAQIGPRHNDEVFMTIAPQSVDKYSKHSELIADIKARNEDPTVIEEGFTAYMLWATKYSEEITLTAKAPVAGGDPKDYLPETPEGIVLYEIILPPDVPEGTPEPPKFNFWTTNTTEPFTADPMEGTFAAGDEYACVATPRTDPESALWSRYLDPDISIKVDNVTDEVVGKRHGYPSVSYKATVDKVDVTGITLNKEELTLEKEANETLEATVAPDDASKKTVTWKSSDDTVATVDSEGKVTAVAVGEATIKATATNGTDATDDDKTATCTVTVTGKSFNITKSEMENGSVTVKVGDAEATKAKEGETVTLVVEPAEGYQLQELQAVYLGMLILDLTEVTEGEEYTFTMPDNDVTVSAKFEKKPVTVKVDVGEGHASLFTSDVLNQIKNKYLLEDATISGNIITLKGVDPQMTEGDMQFAIWSVIDGLTDNDGIDNGDYFLDVGYKPIDDYATEKEYGDDVYGDEHYETPISDGMTFYALWQKPYTKLEIDNGNPKCGMIPWNAMPNVPEGLKLDPENSYWKDGEGEFVESFKGGNEYTFNGQIYAYNWSGDYWKYYFNPDNFTMTVKDAKGFEYNYDGHGWIKFSYKATADHDWAEPTYEWSKDNKTVTAKVVCKGDENHVDIETVDATSKTTAPTCEKAGKTVYTATFTKSPFETQTKTVDVKATGHKWQAPTYTWSKDNSTVTATRVCSNDKSHKETETVKTTSKTTEATTTKEGKTVYTATFKNSAFKTQTKEVAIPKKPAAKIWVRLSGKTGLDTMKTIVNEGFTKTGGTVVVATQDGFKDALAAAGFAGLYKAPIVLTDGTKLSAQAQQELKRLKPARVVVVGGPVVIKDAVLNSIKSATKVTPVRYYGANSAATSAELANRGKGKWKESTAIITTNKSFKDALSVAPIAYAKGYPILLADNGTTLTKPVLDAMKNIGTRQVIIVGGELAVTKNVVSQLNKAGISVKTRLYGANGAKTSAAIANWGLKNGMTANKMGVATGEGYQDALSGAALCGINKSILVLADDKTMDNTSIAKAQKAQIKKGYVFGGESAVGKNTWNALNNATK